MEPFFFNGGREISQSRSSLYDRKARTDSSVAVNGSGIVSWAVAIYRDTVVSYDLAEAWFFKIPNMTP